MKSLVFFLALLFERIHAQAIHLLPAEPFLHSGAYSIRFADPFSFTANAAALAFYDRAGAGVFGQKKFLLKELSSLQAAAYSPVSFGALGFCTQYNGDANYNETEFGLAYGKSWEVLPSVAGLIIATFVLQVMVIVLRFMRMLLRFGKVPTNSCSGWVSEISTAHISEVAARNCYRLFFPWAVDTKSPSSYYLRQK